ncbi:hypothetical protein BAE44_0026248, partial [Dichanthelium oligosanthes]
MAPPSPSARSCTLSMKLLVDGKAGRVLYAEAGKDVVDFLFSLLTLPVGTVVKILSKDSMVGSVGNLYGSVEKLDETYVLSAYAKDALLAPAGGYDGGKLLQLPEPEKASAIAGKGFVQGVVTYSVMDDLKVAPMSTISGITLLNTFGITDISVLQEKTVQLGYAEIHHLLLSPDRDMAAPSPKANTTTLTMKMKLLIDTKGSRVLYAEASKDVVDFLFSLLALPVGTAVELLGKESMAGCVGNVYASVESLDDTYVQPGAAKDALLHPTTVLSPAVGTKGPSLFCLPAPPPPAPPRPKKFFRCSSSSNSNRYGSSVHFSSGTECRGYVTDTFDWICPSCRNHMSTEVTFLTSAEPAQLVEAAAGFVRGVVTYTVMDDLKVAPMSSISGITLLNAFGITDIGMLQERTVQLGYAEVIRH